MTKLLEKNNLGKLKTSICIILILILLIGNTIIPYQQANAVLPALVVAAPEVYALVLTGLATCGVIAANPNESYSLYRDFMSWMDTAGIAIADVINGVDTLNNTVKITPAYISYVEMLKTRGTVANVYNDVLLKSHVMYIDAGNTYISAKEFNFDNSFGIGTYKLKMTAWQNASYYFNLVIDGTGHYFDASSYTYIKFFNNSTTIEITGKQVVDDTLVQGVYTFQNISGAYPALYTEFGGLSNINPTTGRQCTYSYNLSFMPTTSSTNMEVIPTTQRSVAGDTVKTTIRPITDYSNQNYNSIMQNTTIQKTNTVTTTETYRNTWSGYFKDCVSNMRDFTFVGTGTITGEMDYSRVGTWNGAWGYTATGERVWTGTYTGTDALTWEGTATEASTPTTAGTEFKYPELVVPADTLKNKFPFSIPWDLKNAVSSLVATPVAPKWTITFPSEYFVGGGTVVIDFTQFEVWAKIIRWGLMIAFNIFLVLATRKIIGAS